MERIVRLKEEYRGFVGEEYFRIGETRGKSADEQEIILTPLMQEAILAYRRNEEREKKRRLKHTGFDELKSKADERRDLYDEEKLERVMRVLDTLGKKKRSRIISFFFGGYTYEELAAREGVTPSAIRRSIGRSLKEIRKRLEEENE